MSDEFDYLTTSEVAEKIRKSRDYVQRQCANGALRAKKVGDEWRIRPAWLEAFMNDGVAAPVTRPMRRRAS